MSSPSFADLGVPEDLIAVLERRGVVAPFEVQAATIPDALAGRDVCGRAPTGSGKTLAFGIPVIARMQRAHGKKPRALILAPTRELAAQIERALEPLARARNFWVRAVYGGVGYEPQRKALRKGVEVLVACPGRLEDLIEQKAVRLDKVETVVIDEADRMADMGFLPAVRRILDQTSPERQTVLFSATLDGDVKVLTEHYQNDPVRHEVGSPEPDVTAMEHEFVPVEHSLRVAHTADVIGDAGPTVVFTRTRHGADRVAQQLGRAGVRAAAIHGGRSQGQRDRALRDFSKGDVQALIATDVAARGIHVDAVACVVHFDPPEDAKTYVHRSGRTARAGATGLVVSLVQRDQVKAVSRMAKELGIETGLAAGAGNGNGSARPSRGPRKGAKPAGRRDERGTRTDRGERRPEDRGERRDDRNEKRRDDDRARGVGRDGARRGGRTVGRNDERRTDQRGRDNVAGQRRAKSRGAGAPQSRSGSSSARGRS